MKITLLVVGKTTDTHIQALLQDYQKRLGHYIPFSLTVIPELKNTKSLTPEQQKQAEEAAKAAAAKEYAVKKGVAEEETVSEEKTTLSGISDRPYCKGRAYDPNRYRNNTEE